VIEIEVDLAMEIEVGLAMETIGEIWTEKELRINRMPTEEAKTGVKETIEERRPMLRVLGIGIPGIQTIGAQTGANQMPTIYLKFLPIIDLMIYL